jgi:hypothetical protein
MDVLMVHHRRLWLRDAVCSMIQVHLMLEWLPQVANPMSVIEQTANLHGAK